MDAPGCLIDNEEQPRQTSVSPTQEERPDLKVIERGHRGSCPNLR